MTKQIYIYGLVNPKEPAHIRYVGKTIDLTERLKEHIWEGDSSGTYKGNWIASLLKQNIKPEIVTLELTNVDEWPQREQYNIKDLLVKGHKLTNGNAGGIGGIEPTEETRQKLRIAKLGRKLPEEVRAKISISNTGNKHTEEARVKMSLLKIGTKHTEETKLLMSLTRKGRKMSAESIQKMSHSKLGVKFTEEHKKKLSESAKLRHEKNRLLKNN